MLAAVFVNLAYLFSQASLDSVEWDTQFVYLPAARSLLEQGWRFFLSEQSTCCRPLAYLMPAALGLNPVAVKLANIALSGLSVILVYRIGAVLHSPTAGMLGALLFAISPLLALVFPTTLTEPPAIFFTLAWAWALSEASRSGRLSLYCLSGLALGLAILARGTFIYFLYAAILVSGVLYLLKKAKPIPPYRNLQPTVIPARIVGIQKPRKAVGSHPCVPDSTTPQRRGRNDEMRVTEWAKPPSFIRGFLIANLVALIPVGVVIAKNWMMFRFPQIAAGSGSALYQGHHPISLGYDLGYVGLLHDVPGVTQGIDQQFPLSLEMTVQRWPIVRLKRDTQASFSAGENRLIPESAE